jgi:hypothetical protein
VLKHLDSVRTFSIIHLPDKLAASVSSSKLRLVRTSIEIVLKVWFRAELAPARLRFPSFEARIYLSLPLLVPCRHSPPPSYAPFPALRTSGSISSASFTLYAASEADETDNSSAPSSPLPPLFRATAGTSPWSAVTVLVKDCAVRTIPLQRTVSMPSPLAREGIAHKSESGGVPKEAAAPPLSDTPTPAFKTKPSFSESVGPFSDWERGTSPGPPSPDPPGGHVASSPRPKSQRRGRDFDVSMAGGDVCRAERDVSGELELEALRAQVRELRLVSAMRAREAERYAKRLEVMQTEVDAVAR